MHKYRVLAPITLRDLQLRLTDQQLADRRYVVRPVPGAEGVFEPLTDVSFKAGEEIEISTQVPKGLYGRLQPLDVDPAEKADAAPADVASAEADAGASDTAKVPGAAKGSAGGRRRR